MFKVSGPVESCPYPARHERRRLRSRGRPARPARSVAEYLDAVAAVRALLPGGVDYAFEAIGLKIAAEQAFAMLARGGAATVIGMIPEGQSIEIPGDVLMGDEKRLQGSNMGSNRFRIDIPRYVDLYMNGRLNLDDLISARISLDQVNEGYEALNRGEVARSVIVFD